MIDMSRPGEPGAADRPGRYRPARRFTAAIVALSVAVYLLRFGSSLWLLSAGESARFDPHGFGTFGDGVLLAALAAPLAVLLWWIMRRRGVWRGWFAPASRRGWTLLSAALLLLLGAPTPNQLWAAILLPAAQAWPALASAAAWFATVALLRALAVTAPRAARGATGSSP